MGKGRSRDIGSGQSGCGVVYGKIYAVGIRGQIFVKFESKMLGACEIERIGENCNEMIP